MRIFQAFTSLMRKKGSGLKVNISSGTATQAPPLQGIYAASKAAFDIMCEAYRMEVQPFGIFVMQFHSTGIATQMRKEQTTYSNRYYEEITEKVKQIEHNMLGVLPENLAKAIANFIEQQTLRPFISVQDVMNEINTVDK